MKHSVVVDADSSVPEAVLAAYGLDRAQIELLPGGRTNRTMHVRAGRELVLQQMLGSAHGDLLGIMENLVRVTSHLEWRRTVENQGDSWYPLLVPTSADKPFIMTDDGDVWRAFAFRRGEILRASQSLAMLSGAAALYGRFAAQTADLGGPPLNETSPDFHSLDRVYASFYADFEQAPAPEQAVVAAELERVEALKRRVEICCQVDGAVWAPDRVVHNDAKLSNVLFDQGQATAVLDLDLAMMGPLWHDVGDLVRSSCWHAPGSDGQPAFSLELFQAVIGAFSAAAGDSLSAEELATFAVAGPRLSLELGLRYLNDHLRTEPHLMVEGADGHLRRGLSNVKLAEEMLNAYDALRQIVDTTIADR